VVSVLQWKPFVVVLGKKSVFHLLELGECKLETGPMCVLIGIKWPTEFCAKVLVVVGSLRCIP